MGFDLQCQEGTVVLPDDRIDAPGIGDRREYRAWSAGSSLIATTPVFSSGCLYGRLDAQSVEEGFDPESD